MDIDLCGLRGQTYIEASVVLKLSIVVIVVGRWIGHTLSSIVYIT